MGSVGVHVKLTAAEGKGAELVEAFASLYQGPLDAEEGTLVHIIHQANDAPDTVFFYELYASDDAVAAHNSGEALRAIFPKLAGLVAGPPEMLSGSAKYAKGVSVT